MNSGRFPDLMHRTFGVDVLACPRCGGRLLLIALIEEAAVIGRILEPLGVATEIPPPRPARAPPLPVAMPDVARWDDDIPVLTFFAFHEPSAGVTIGEPWANLRCAKAGGAA